MSEIKDMQDNILLSVNELRTWFQLKRWGFLRAGFVRAVDGVTFQLKRSEAITIVGESGSGKTSLLRTILGLARPTAGQITFDGRSLDGQKAEDLAWLRSHV
jgi:peptide/nickel transport system ATP-binding protein